MNPPQFSPERIAEMEKLMLSAERLDELVTDHMRFVESSLTSRHDSWIPMLSVWHVSAPGEPESMTMCALAMDFNEDWEKRSTLAQLGKKFFDERQHVVAVV